MNDVQLEYYSVHSKTHKLPIVRVLKN